MEKEFGVSPKARGWDFAILQKIKLDHEGTQVTHAAFIKT